jgi:hypothetical protein
MGVTLRRQGSPRSGFLRWLGVSTLLGLLSVLGSSLAGCASSSSGVRSPQLQCTVQLMPQGVDVAQTTLRCTVADAPQDDTRFTLTYALVDDNGTQQAFDLPCEGALANGTGTCQQIYSVVAPRSPTESKIFGVLLPSNRALGPVAPTEPAR